MGRCVYDVYDLEGNKVIEKKTGIEIAQELNTDPDYVVKCAHEKKYLLDKYEISKAGELINKKSCDIEKMLLSEWDKVTAPLRKVIWVKEYGPGVRKLNAQRR